ncbi:aspartate kinase [Niabella drilacis]|uniref:Aspartokinase n=2 Tax=Niabella drilacis (strain DSM 25811 / CCM 8410 / CCUG 62505 / LMG 26954 / E90) TaxID=1285928 RepID=A0A1G6ZGF4_NIADE|nr:aspartate kinase [Niabella drilacis]
MAKKDDLRCKTKKMKVYKFGGASVNSAERISNVAAILERFSDDDLVIVISAMGKTTNALEKVVQAFYAEKKEEALQLFDEIKRQHLTTAKYLLVTHYLACEARLRDCFTEVEWMLHDAPVREFDYYYDQVVSVGELLATCIVSFYLSERGIQNEWVDVRDIFRTDDNFRDANINWAFTQQQVDRYIQPLVQQKKWIITQGFIGATDENESTTLGREGSDYSAALFANMLNAASLTIWKDVESVMSADPKQIPDAVPIHSLSYNEVIEMAYYGAQVIHPKTIKPLQNKNIPLYVKCFLDADLPGTIIHNSVNKDLPPIIVIKENQVMMELKTKDFSFVGDAHAYQLYQWFNEHSLRPTLTQNGAISLIFAFDNWEEKISRFSSAAAGMFDVHVTPGLTLTTIRHYNQAALDRYINNKEMLVKQQTQRNIRVLHRS